MKVKTARFGDLEVGDDEVIQFSDGILGFPEFRKYCLVDTGDDTLIMWLQSLEDMNIAFPVLEPKIFKPDYIVKLSAQELAQLKLNSINQSAVFTILTIPKDVSQMTANLKAPLVVNLGNHSAKQVILQENEYALKHPMFKELKMHLATIDSSKAAQKTAQEARESTAASAVNLKNMTPATHVRAL